MNRVSDWPNYYVSGVPRASGDEPSNWTMAHDGLESSPQAGMNRLIDVENPTAMRVPCASEGGPMDWVIDHLDVKEFPTSGDGPWIQQ